MNMSCVAFFTYKYVHFYIFETYFETYDYEIIIILFFQYSILWCRYVLFYIKSFFFALADMYNMLSNQYVHIHQCQVYLLST